MISFKRVKYYLLVAALVVGVKAVVIAGGIYSDTSKVNSLLSSAQTLQDSNQFSNSLALCKQALELSVQLKYALGEAKSLYFFGKILSNNGLKDSSIITYKKAISLYRNFREDSFFGDILNGIGNTYYDIAEKDSAEFYFNEALKIRVKLDDKTGLIKSYNNLGILNYHRGLYSNALEYYYQALSLLETVPDLNTKSTILNNVGGVFWSQADYTKALDYFFQSLKIKEELKDIKNAAFINNNIGTIYWQMGDLHAAMKYYNISLENSESINDSLTMSYPFMGIGDIYHYTGEHIKALDYYRKSEEIRKKYSFHIGLANLYVSMGNLYKDMGQNDKALITLKEANDIYIRYNEPLGKAKSLIHIGEVYLKIGLVQKAIETCNLGIAAASQIKALEILKDGYLYLNKAFEHIGNTNQAYSTYKLYIAYRDSITSLDKAKEIFKLQLQADFDKVLIKQKLSQNNELGLAQLKSIKQTKIANIFILAFSLTLAVFIVFFINNRQKQKHNTLLGFQKLDMERQKSELTVQRDELQLQKDLVIHQRDKIMTMLTDLGESIDYARKIQQALLPSDKTLEILLGEYFLFFQPRESVGGDFYWVAKDEQTTYFAVADCTGHGVPGGFMSMLGVSLLNELISRSDCTSPAKMLWNLRELIMKALSQTGMDEDSQDGMDIALCMYNSQTRQLVYAGANLSLFLVTATPPPAGEKVLVNDNLVELKPDRMPVSYYLRMIEFNEHHLVLSPGDCIYLSSDGYTDQFGGPNNKKFGYNTFKNLILSASNKPLDKQRDIFWNEFDKWKGEENQTDDVIVMGIKIS